MRNGYHGDHTQSAQNSVEQEKKLELGNVAHRSMEENLVRNCLNAMLIGIRNFVIRHHAKVKTALKFSFVNQCYSMYKISKESTQKFSFLYSVQR